MIRYVDSGGWTWEVCESVERTQDGMADVGRARAGLADPRLRPADAPPEDEAGELYFFSRLGTRKLRGYPSSWFRLPRTELEALCETAQLV